MPLLTSQGLSNFINQTALNTTKISQQNLLDIYRDRWDYIINWELSQQFEEKTFKKLRLLKSKEINIIKRVVNEKALVYKKKAIRKALLKTTKKNDEGKEIRDEDEAYTEVLKTSNIDATMKMVNKLTELTNQVLVKTVWRNSRVEYDIITFDNAELFTSPDDWQEIQAIKYFINLELPDFDSQDRQHLGVETSKGFRLAKFTTAFLFTLDKEKNEGKIFKHRFGAKFDPAKTDSQPNPYQIDGKVILPFTLFTRQIPVDRLLDFTTGADLLDAGINVALHVTYINELIKMQSFKQPVIKLGDRKQLVSGLDIGPGKAILIEDPDGNSDVTAIDLEANIDKQWGIVRERSELAFASRGISAENFKRSGNPASGFAIELSNRTLLEAREDDIEIYRAREQDLFKVTRAVHNEHSNKPISEDAEFQINFAEATFPESKTEKARSRTIEIANNVSTPVDWIMEDDPDLTREQAVAIFERNKSFNQANNPPGVNLQRVLAPTLNNNNGE